VICTVEDSELAELLARRLRSTANDGGVVVEMEYKAQEGGKVLRERPIIRSHQRFCFRRKESDPGDVLRRLYNQAPIEPSEPAGAIP